MRRLKTHEMITGNGHASARTVVAEDELVLCKKEGKPFRSVRTVFETVRRNAKLSDDAVRLLAGPQSCKS